MEVLKTEGLTHHYGGSFARVPAESSAAATNAGPARFRGIDDVCLSLQAGEILGFLGPNGAGKSTTIRVLLGFLRAHQGTATILGKDCWGQSAQIKQEVGYVAGDVRLYPWFTTRRALEIVGRIRHQDLKPEGFRLAERLRLEVDLPVRKMSRGNRQKVALVLALAHRPRLVILDEPTSGLDPVIQEALCETLREMANEGRSVFFSSHTLSEVESLCHQVVMVRDGRVVLNESLRSLKQRAPRLVQVRWPASKSESSIPPAINWPPCLRNPVRQGDSWTFQMTGSSTELIQWAAGQAIDDLSIGTPSLETLFHDLYQTRGSNPT